MKAYKYAQKKYKKIRIPYTCTSTRMYILGTTTSEALHWQLSSQEVLSRATGVRCGTCASNLLSDICDGSALMNCSVALR